MRRLQSSSATPSVVAGGVASTSASTSRKRRKRNERKTDDEDVAVAVKQIKEQQEEKKKNKNPELPDELWAKIFEDVDDDSITAFASVNKQLRRVEFENGKDYPIWFGTSLKHFDDCAVLESLEYDKLRAVSEDWCLWSMSCLKFQKRKMKLMHRRRIMNAAAFSGYLDALKHWRKQSRAKNLFDEHTCAYAAFGGQLEVLKYLHENGCPWDEMTYEAAELEDRLEVLDYLHENGYPFSPQEF